ncbi:MAG: hypothetical protein HUK22_06800, partial [Thermoguttaceae bacterium]|nr:hypothetical protein [Thermoguttaceae bacterium]
VFKVADVDAFNAAARAANVVDLVATPQAEPQEGEFAALFDTTAPRDVVADSAAPARPAETAPKTAAARAPKFRDEYDPAIFNARSQTDDSARRY